MRSISRFSLAGNQRLKQLARETLAVNYDASARCEARKELIGNLSNIKVSDLDRKIKYGQDLSFEEAFCGMCYVLAATNLHLFEIFQPAFAQACGRDFSPEKAIAVGSAFLNLMATKEALSVLTADEIAGMVAAAMIDSVVAFNLGEVTETCGMGGDKGFGKEGGAVSKSINVSTLTSLVLSSLQVPTIKHGSYGNSSLMGSTDAIEKMGVRTSFESEAQVRDFIARTGYCYFDAHLSKTLHDLSHLLMMETINHIIGPMTPPITSNTKINKLIGVNEKVHPQTVVEAYNLLHAWNIQRSGGIIAVAGLDTSEGIDPNDHPTVRKHVILDEMSPHASVIAVGRGFEHLGTFLVRPEDFGITIDPSRIQVVNDKAEIESANKDALSGKNSDLADYLAMNATLGLYAAEYLNRPQAVTPTGLNKEFLRECYSRCREAISSGKSYETLSKCREASKS